MGIMKIYSKAGSIILFALTSTFCLRTYLIVMVMIMVQPAYAVTQTEDECIKFAYTIGYNITETHNNTMNALSELEADCIYSGKISLEVKCLVWLYDIGIRNGELIASDSGYDEFYAST